MTKPVSKEAEARLLDAVQQASDLASAGMHPNEAVVKAAMDNGVPLGHIEPLAQAFNVGATRHQMANGNDVFEKTSEFPLADVALIKSKVYPAAMTKSAKAVVPDVVSGVYMFRPSSSVSTRIEKQAGVALPPLDPPTCKTPPPPLPRDDVDEFKKLSAARNHEEHRARTARGVVFTAYERFAGGVEALGEYFTKVGSDSISTVRANLAITRGEIATDIIDTIADQHPVVGKHLDKTASASGRAAGPAYEMVDKIIEDGKAYFAAEAELEKLGEEIAVKVREIETKMFGAPESIVDGSVGLPFVGFTQKWAAGEAPWWASPGNVMRQISKGVSGVGGKLLDAPETLKPYSRSPKYMDADSLEAGQGQLAAELSSPDHLNDINKVRSVGNFYNLLASDPVIRNHDPAEVANAYNDITQVAPDLAGQRMSMQSLLRKRLAQDSFDPFDVKQVMEMGQLAGGKPARGSL